MIETKEVARRGRTRGEQSAYFASMARLCEDRGRGELARWYRFFAKWPEEYGTDRRPITAPQVAEALESVQ